MGETIRCKNTLQVPSPAVGRPLASVLVKICSHNFTSLLQVMVPAHFDDVDGNLSDYNGGKSFGLSKILTVIL